MTVVWIENTPKSKEAEVYETSKVKKWSKNIPNEEVGHLSQAKRQNLFFEISTNLCSNLQVLLKHLYNQSYVQSKQDHWVTVLLVDFCFSGIITDQNRIWAY